MITKKEKEGAFIIRYMGMFLWLLRRVNVEIIISGSASETSSQ